MIEISISLPKSELKEFDLLEQDLRKSTLKAVKKAMLFVEGESKARFDTPGNLKVLTGTLRRSIRSAVSDEINKIKGSIFTDVTYGPVHELGLIMRSRSGSTYKMPKRPFLEPAISENLDKISNIITDDIVKSLAR